VSFREEEREEVFMSTDPGYRSIDVMSAALAGLVFVAALEAPFAQTASPAEPSKQADTFTGTTVNLSPGAGETVSIHILRWSSEADRDRLAAAFKDKGDAGVQGALEAAPTFGIAWTGESLGYSLRYAHRVALPDGGERVIVATERRLGAWSRGNQWQAAGKQPAPAYPFTVIELRVNRRGQGEGKMSLATKVTFEQETKTLALENYASVPILIKDVKRASPAVGAPTN
jgi:hypothetical protein